MSNRNLGIGLTVSQMPLSVNFIIRFVYRPAQFSILFIYLPLVCTRAELVADESYRTGGHNEKLMASINSIISSMENLYENSFKYLKLNSVGTLLNQVKHIDITKDTVLKVAEKLNDVAQEAIPLNAAVSLIWINRSLEHIDKILIVNTTRFFRVPHSNLNGI